MKSVSVISEKASFLNFKFIFWKNENAEKQISYHAVFELTTVLHFH